MFYGDGRFADTLVSFVQPLGFLNVRFTQSVTTAGCHEPKKPPNSKRGNSRITGPFASASRRRWTFRSRRSRRRD